MKRKKKTADAEGTDSAAASGGKSMMVPAVVVAVAVLGAGFMMKGGGAQPAAAAPAPEPTEQAEGPVVETEPMTLNLADGHYLKVGVALQMRAPGAEGSKHGGGGGEEGPSTAKALDLAIAEFSEHTKKQLSNPSKREAVKTKLAAKISKAYHDEVLDIYFTEFVMQ